MEAPMSPSPFQVIRCSPEFSLTAALQRAVEDEAAEEAKEPSDAEGAGVTEQWQLQGLKRKHNEAGDGYSEDDSRDEDAQADPQSTAHSESAMTGAHDREPVRRPGLMSLSEPNQPAVGVAPADASPSTGTHATTSARKAYNKKHKNAARKAKKQKVFDANATKPPASRVTQAVGAATTLQVPIALNNLPANSSGYEATSGGSKSDRPLNLQELVAEGYRVVEWDGQQPLILADDDTDKIFFAGVPKPGKDATYDASCDAVLELFGQLEASFTEEEFSHLRGDGFAAINFGNGAGRGPAEPYNLRKCTDQHPDVVEALLQSVALERLALHQSASLQLYVPKLYDLYHSHTVPVRQRLSYLKPNWTRSMFSAAACNIGRQVATFLHRDCRNLSYGFCAVHAIGKFDHTKGGHIVLKEPKLIIQFPAGAHVLLPSATITHGNIPVQDGEIRVSFTQYTAGAMFRYVDNDFGTEKKLKKKSKAKYQKMLEDKATRWKTGLGLWSTVDELLSGSRSPTTSAVETTD